MWEGSDGSSNDWKKYKDWKLDNITMLIGECNALFSQYRPKLKRGSYGSYSLPKRFRKTKFLISTKFDNANINVDEVTGSIVHIDLSGGRWNQMIALSFDARKLYNQMKNASDLRISISHEELNFYSY